ncbi:hypothetical protein ACWDVG_26770, partial [Streptomyces sp. NPDC003327]
KYFFFFLFVLIRWDPPSAGGAARPGGGAGAPGGRPPPGGAPPEAADGSGERTGPEPAAIVSRGGRPDLAGERLAGVRAPTLLVVGGDDALVLDLNRRARALLRCENRLAVVPGATHLFEEPGALEEVARLATSWFTGHFPGADQ